MSSSLLLQQCPTRLVRLTWIVFVMGGKLPPGIVQYCSQLSCVIAVKLFSIHSDVVLAYRSINTTVAWKKTAFYFIGQV